MDRNQIGARSAPRLAGTAKAAIKKQNEQWGASVNTIRIQDWEGDAGGCVWGDGRSRTWRGMLAS